MLFHRRQIFSLSDKKDLNKLQMSINIIFISYNMNLITKKTSVIVLDLSA